MPHAGIEAEPTQTIVVAKAWDDCRARSQNPSQGRRELLSRMANDTFKDIEKLETDLWEAADNLRANSKLTSSDYFMPVLGVIFLRHAANR
ncbi:MAG: hypothetical protein AAB297_07660, partial [Acidobacteriota bacterium]